MAAAAQCHRLANVSAQTSRLSICGLFGSQIRCTVGEPLLGLGMKDLRLATPEEPDFARVQSVVAQDQPLPLLGRQTVLDQGQVQILVTSIELVAYDRVPEVRQVNAYLVLASRLRPHQHQREE